MEWFQRSLLVDVRCVLAADGARQGAWEALDTARIPEGAVPVPVGGLALPDGAYVDRVSLWVGELERCALAVPPAVEFSLVVVHRCFRSTARTVQWGPKAWPAGSQHIVTWSAGVVGSQVVLSARVVPGPGQALALPWRLIVDRSGAPVQTVVGPQVV